MTHLQIIDLIKDTADAGAIREIAEDLRGQILNQEKALRFCKSTAEKAQKAYATSAKIKDVRGLYSDGTTALLTKGGAIDGTTTKAHESTINAIMEHFRNPAPVDNNLIIDIATFCTLKKQGGENILLEIGASLYNPALIKKGLECVCTKKADYIQTMQKGKDGRQTLIIRGDAGAFLVLPVYRGEATSLHFTKTCDFCEIFTTLENIQNGSYKKVSA